MINFRIGIRMIKNKYIEKIKCVADIFDTKEIQKVIESANKNITIDKLLKLGSDESSIRYYLPIGFDLITYYNLIEFIGSLIGEKDLRVNSHGGDELSSPGYSCVMKNKEDEIIVNATGGRKTILVTVVGKSIEKKERYYDNMVIQFLEDYESGK